MTSNMITSFRKFDVASPKAFKTKSSSMGLTVVARVLCLQALVAAVEISKDTNQKTLTDEIEPPTACDPVWVNQGGIAVYTCVKKGAYYPQDGQEQTKVLEFPQDSQEVNKAVDYPQDGQEHTQDSQVSEFPQDSQEVNKAVDYPQDGQEHTQDSQVSEFPQDSQEVNKVLEDSQEVTEVPVDTAIHTEPGTSQVTSIVFDMLLRAQPFTVYNLGLLVTACCVMLAVLQYTVVRHKTSTWYKLGYPGPPCSSILGNYWEVLIEGGLRRCVKRWHAQYGNVFGIHLGLSPVLVICDTSLIAGILENESGCFASRSNITAALNCPSLKFSLFNVSDSRWLTMRYSLSFLFNEENLTYMVQHLNPCAGRLANYLHQELQNTGVVSLKEFVTSYEYDIIASLLLGLKLDHHIDNNAPFFQYVTSALQSASMECEGVTVPSDMKRLFGYVQCAVHDRSEHRTFREPVDYLDLLLRRGASLAPVAIPPYELKWPEVYSNLLLWILHSHQTMISALQFVIYMLAHNPSYQNMAFTEMECTLGNRDLTYHDLQELAVLDSVILETLRLFSPVQEIWRRSNFDTKIFGLAFPRDVDILIPVDLVHSNEIYFSNPDHFQPERWGLGTFGELPHPAFLAFGYGPRACIASDLVLLQLKVALVHCMRRMKFEPAHQDPPPPKQHLEVKLGLAVTSEGILRPATSVKVQLISRECDFSQPLPTQRKPSSVPHPPDAASHQPSSTPRQPSPVPVKSKVSQSPQETTPSFKAHVSVQLIETGEGVQPIRTGSLTSTPPASFDPDARRELRWKEDEQLTSHWPKDTAVFEVDVDEVGKQILPSLATALDSASRAFGGKQADLVPALPLYSTPRPPVRDTTPHRPYKELPPSYLPGSVDSNLLVAPYEGDVEEHPLFRDFRAVQDMAQHLLEELDRVSPGDTRPEHGLLLPRETDRARLGDDHFFLGFDISCRTPEVENESPLDQPLDQPLSRYFSAIELSDENFAVLAETETTTSCDSQASEYQTTESVVLQNMTSLYNRLKRLGSYLVITLHISDDTRSPGPRFFELEESQDAFESRCLAFPLHGPRDAGVDTRLPFTSRAASQIPWQASTETQKAQATSNEVQAKSKRIIMQVGVPRSGLGPVQTEIVDEITEAAQDVRPDGSQPFQSELSVDVTQPSRKSMTDDTLPSVRMSGAVDSQPSEGMPMVNAMQPSGTKMANATQPSGRMSVANATQPPRKWSYAKKPRVTDWPELVRRLKEAKIRRRFSSEDLGVPREKSSSGYFKRPWGRATGKPDNWPPLRKPEIPERFFSNTRPAATHGTIQIDREAPKTPASNSSSSSFTTASTSSSSTLTTASTPSSSTLTTASTLSSNSLSTNANDGAGPSFRERSQSLVQSLNSFIRNSSILSPSLATNASDGARPSLRERSNSLVQSLYSFVGKSPILSPALAKLSSPPLKEGLKNTKTIGHSDRTDQFKTKASSLDNLEESKLEKTSISDHEELTEEEIPSDDLKEIIQEENILVDNEDTIKEEIPSDDLEETIQKENIVDNEDTVEEEIPSDDLEETIQKENIVDNEDTVEEEIPSDDLEETIQKENIVDNEDTVEEESPSDDLEETITEENVLADSEDAIKKEIPSDDLEETIKEESPLDNIDDTKDEESSPAGVQEHTGERPQDGPKMDKKEHKDGAKNEEESKDGAEKEKSPKDSAEKEKSPKDGVKKEKNPKDGAKKEKQPKDGAEKEKSPKDSADKEKGPKDGAKKEKGPKDGAKKEKGPKDGAKKKKKA